MALDLKSYVIGKQSSNDYDNITVEELNVTENGTYTPEEGKAFGEVNANVQPPLEEKTIIENGVVTPAADKYGLSKVTVNVPLPSGTVQITENGTANVKDYEYADVDVQPKLQSKTTRVLYNGSQRVRPDSEYDGLSEVIINTNVQPDLQSKTATENGVVLPDTRKDGLSSVTVAVPPPTLQDKTVTQNGTFTADTGYDGLDEVTVNVQPDLESKQVSITANGTQTVTPAAGKDGMSSVEITTNVPSYPEPTGSLTITENGENIDVKDVASVDVNVPVSGENKLAKLLSDEAVTLTPEDFGNATSIYKYQFENRTNLDVTSLPSSITSIGQHAFFGCTALSLEQLPNGLTSIGSSAFSGDIALRLTALPDTVTNIESGVFSGCTNLALTALPSGITRIYAQTFQNCINNRISTIPASITRIDDYAFQDVRQPVITFEGTPASLSSTGFHASPNITDIYVPWSEGEVANAPWGARNATIHYNYTPPTE